EALRDRVRPQRSRAHGLSSSGMSHPPESSPPIAAGDICVFTHGTHAVSIVDDAGRHEQVTLGDARRTVVDVHRAGRTVWLGAEDAPAAIESAQARSEEHTSELQSRFALVCRLLL